jgi:hypothetical protein
MQTLKNFYGYLVYYLCWISRSQWLLTQIPVERLVLPVQSTPRISYDLERRVYRASLRVQRLGIDLSRREYHYYRLIAEKYKWPYIKELYED